MTLEFTAQDKAKTLLELTHIRFIDEETRDNHEIGWGNILAALDDLS